MPEFNNDLKPIVDFVGVTFRDSKEHHYLELWRQAEFGYFTEPDRGGADDFYLRVGLRASAFRTLGSASDRQHFETKVKEIAEPVVNAYDDVWLCRVVVYPIPEADDSWRGGIARPIQASTDEVSRIWKEGYFRLFLSHSSSDKEFATSLKESFRRVRIDTFVAHQDIEPNLTWQSEIKLALASCHGLLFVASDKSNESIWCQQEVGWAMGRGLFATSYSLSADPKGFVGAFQDWHCSRHEPVDVRKRLLEFLVKDDKTEPAIREPLVQLLQSSKDDRQLDFSLGYLNMLRSLSDDQVERLASVLSLPFIAKNKQLKERVLVTLARFGYQEPKPANNQEDEYDPFADD